MSENITTLTLGAAETRDNGYAESVDVARGVLYAIGFSAPFWVAGIAVAAIVFAHAAQL